MLFVGLMSTAVFSADDELTGCGTCEQCCRVKQENIYQSCLKQFAKNLCEGTALGAYNSCNNDCPEELN